MLRFASIALFAAALFAQNPADLFNKPPADVDEALRARITEFHQYHVTQEFRKAEKLVAEDSQDFFYTHNKPHYLSFEIRSIKYSDDFTKALAVVICEQFVPMPGFTDKPMKVPTPSNWKLIDGKWYWYVDQKEFNKTAFGQFTPGPGKGATAPPSLPSSLELPYNLVRPDRQAVALKPNQAEQVTLANGSVGYMSLAISNQIAGVDAKLDKTLLKPGEKAILTLRRLEGAKAGAIVIRVEQTQEEIPIQVTLQ